MASDYTRGLSLQAIKLVFDHLENSVKRPDRNLAKKCIMHQPWQGWHLPMHS